jgi:hypothetical protein
MNEVEFLGLRHPLEAPPSATSATYSKVAFPKPSVVKKTKPVCWKHPLGHRVTARDQAVARDLRESVLRDCRSMLGKTKAQSATQDQQRSTQAMHVAMLNHDTLMKDNKHLRPPQDSTPVATKTKKKIKQVLVASNMYACASSSPEAAEQIAAWCARLEASVQKHRWRNRGGGIVVVQQLQPFPQTAALAAVATSQSQTCRIGSPPMVFETESVSTNLVLPSPPNAAQKPLAEAMIPDPRVHPSVIATTTPKVSGIVETLVTGSPSRPVWVTRFSDLSGQREVALHLEQTSTSILPSTLPAQRLITTSQNDKDAITKARLQAALYSSGR